MKAYVFFLYKCVKGKKKGKGKKKTLFVSNISVH